MKKEQLTVWVKTYAGEALAGITLFVLVIMMIILKRQFAVTIGVIASVCIAAIGIENRAKIFDKLVSILVVFSLAVGFMIFD